MNAYLSRAEKGLVLRSSELSPKGIEVRYLYTVTSHLVTWTIIERTLTVLVARIWTHVFVQDYANAKHWHTASAWVIYIIYVFNRCTQLLILWL